jgi:hypothetical protein
VRVLWESSLFLRIEVEALCYISLNPEKLIHLYIFFSVRKKNLVLVLKFMVDTKRVMEIFFFFFLDECRQNLEDYGVGFIFMG